METVRAHIRPFETGGRSRNHKQLPVPVSHSEESEAMIARTCILPWQTPSLSFRELSREHNLLGTDDWSFHRWCSDVKKPETYVHLINSLLFFSDEDKNWQLDQVRKKAQRSYLPLWKDSWESKQEDKAPACQAHPLILINGSQSVKGRDKKDFLFQGENTMSCAVHLKPQLSRMFIPCSHGRLQRYE